MIDVTARLSTPLADRYWIERPLGLALIMQEDLPITFLYKGTYTVAHRRLRGLSSPWRAEPYMYADQLWLEDER
jgi:hypothetical protein